MLPGSSLDASTPSKQLTSRFADIRLDIGLDPDLDPDLDRDISLIGSGEPAPTRRSELCWPTTSCCCACLSTSHSAPSSAAPPILQVSFSLLFTHVGVLLREGKGRLAPRSSLLALRSSLTPGLLLSPWLLCALLSGALLPCIGALAPAPSSRTPAHTSLVWASWAPPARTSACHLLPVISLSVLSLWTWSGGGVREGRGWQGWGARPW
jgi:hypothetical protein